MFAGDHDIGAFPSLRGPWRLRFESKSVGNAIDSPPEKTASKPAVRAFFLNRRDTLDATDAVPVLPVRVGLRQCSRQEDDRQQ